ncbi:hypothetical protein OHB53_44490 [Streptomyces sp. NBC_00056]|uniref:hypothetical protein n=1 Tax=unclassified Streptomyces TaxID=2593676 RepID=UPI0022538AF3|nr:hypothetical protein [Streptomyces sp. NBC_00063]MCX5443183.1 hypothetical protein [Streptomyces sp. NBC_00063]
MARSRRGDNTTAAGDPPARALLRRDVSVPGAAALAPAPDGGVCGRQPLHLIR